MIPVSSMRSSIVDAERGEQRRHVGASTAGGDHQVGLEVVPSSSTTPVHDGVEPSVAPARR